MIEHLQSFHDQVSVSVIVVCSQVVYPAPQGFTHREKCLDPLERPAASSRRTDQNLSDIKIVFLID